MTPTFPNPLPEAQALRAIVPGGINGSRNGGTLTRRRYQRGALRKEGNLWVLRWREDILEAGTVSRVERRARVGTIKDLPTKTLARRVADQIIEHVNAPDYRPGKVITLEDFAEIYARDAAPNFTPSAEKTVHSVSRTLIVPSIGKFRLDEITGRVPQLMINTLQKRGLSRKTIKNAVSQLSAMLKTARGWGYIATKLDWETLFIPPEDVEKEVRCFTPDEAQRIIDAAPEPFNVCFACMAYLGLRAGEALGLVWANVDFENAVLLIRQSAWCGRIKTVKAKASRRDLPIPDALRTMLADYRKRWHPNDSDLLFTNKKGKAFGADYARRKILHPIREKLGIARGAFHAFRHGHATIMFSEGANPKVVQDSMGHANIKTTMRYTHAISNDRREAVERATQVFMRRSAVNLINKSLVVN
jgi:integrase